MSAFRRRSTDREPPPGTPIAEFANGHDALEFVKVCKDKTSALRHGLELLDGACDALSDYPVVLEARS